jgi:hypothetical protein
MTAVVYHKKMARALERMGGLYTVQDILTGIAEGRFQSFTWNNSWGVTQIQRYPRARVLEVVIAVGDLDDCRKVHDKILQFAEENNIGLVTAYGRCGWRLEARRAGWKVKTTSYLYHKEL